MTNSIRYIIILTKLYSLGQKNTITDEMLVINGMRENAHYQRWDVGLAATFNMLSINEAIIQLNIKSFNSMQRTWSTQSIHNDSLI